MAHRHPTVLFLPERQRRVRAGHPWAYSNELQREARLDALAPGTVVRLCDAAGDGIGLAFFNPKPLVAARLLTREMEQTIDRPFIAQRIARAAALRDALGFARFRRVVHGEADGLPGLIVDQFGPVVVAQMNAAGLELLREAVLGAIVETLAPETLILRNDSAGRALDGLEQGVETVQGAPPADLTVEEDGLRFRIDPIGGQKTGWYYDQRRTRAAIRPLAAGAEVLDLFSHSGGFALSALAGGAARATLVDRSEPALALAQESAGLNGLADRMETIAGDALAAAERMIADGRRFDLVIADPPAFVKARKDLAIGMKTYRKTARLAAELTRPGGFMLFCSCSHNVTAEALGEALSGGLVRARRGGRILRAGGAAEDHPVHPFLPESGYLKTLLLQVD